MGSSVVTGEGIAFRNGSFVVFMDLYNLYAIANEAPAIVNVRIGWGISLEAGRVRGIVIDVRKGASIASNDFIQRTYVTMLAAGGVRDRMILRIPSKPKASVVPASVTAKHADPFAA